MSTRIRKRALVLSALAVLLAAAAQAPAQTPLPPDLGAKVLPSFAVLAIQTADGRAATGSGFLTIKDGLLATAWHLVKGAKAVVARFPSGEEFECTGVVDKDEKRNVALLRVRVFGRPLLKMDAAEPRPGTAAAVAAVKDGAFGLVGVTVGETTVADGVRLTALSGDIPEGNSGSPVVDAQGRAFGLLVARQTDGRSDFFILPAGSVLGLDATLPTQPWGASAPPATGSTGGVKLMAIDEVDARLGRTLLAVTEGDTCLSWAWALTQGYGFKNGVPGDFYQAQQTLDTATASLNEIRTDDELRLRIGRGLVQILAGQKAAGESFIRGVVAGQQAKTWIAQADDALKRANSFRQAVTQQIAALKADLVALESASPKFREFLPFEQRYLLGLAERPSGFKLGVTTYPRNPFYLLVVTADGLGHKIGLRPGDLIVSVVGKTFTTADDFEELKLLIKANLGKTIPAAVERGGKAQTIKLKIPKEIPKDALYTS